MDDRCQSERRPVGGGHSLFLSQLERTQLTLPAKLDLEHRGSPQSARFHSE